MTKRERGIFDVPSALKRSFAEQGLRAVPPRLPKRDYSLQAEPLTPEVTGSIITAITKMQRVSLTAGRVLDDLAQKFAQLLLDKTHLPSPEDIIDLQSLLSLPVHAEAEVVAAFEELRTSYLEISLPLQTARELIDPEGLIPLLAKAGRVLFRIPVSRGKKTFERRTYDGADLVIFHQNDQHQPMGTVLKLRGLEKLYPGEMGEGLDDLVPESGYYPMAEVFQIRPDQKTATRVLCRGQGIILTTLIPVGPNFEAPDEPINRGGASCYVPILARERGERTLQVDINDGRFLFDPRRVADIWNGILTGQPVHDFWRPVPSFSQV